MTAPVRKRAVFGRVGGSEAKALAEILRNETVGGVLLLVAALAALLWANLGRESYDSLTGIKVGPEALHLNLSLEKWASEGLLAIFFLVAGLELKRELIVGELRRPSQAVLPLVAAICGVVGPALAYLAVIWIFPSPGAARGWAVPTATDIAFALAVLAVIGSALPTAARAFLLSLAVIDDVIAISIIAIFYTASIDLVPLLGSVACLALYSFLQHRRITTWVLLVPIGLLAWGLMHAAGVHATVAGVAIGLLTRVHRDRGEKTSPAEHLEHNLRPVSAGVAAPLFALTAAGVPFGLSAMRDMLADPAAMGVVAGLIIGASVGVFAGTWLTVRLTGATLSADLEWPDVAGIALLAGIGFTVSLLVGDLAFTADDPARSERVRAAVLVGSVGAAILASILLLFRNRHYKRLVDEGDRPDPVWPDKDPGILGT